MESDKMSEKVVAREETNGNSALDWEIFDILCREELGLPVSFFFYFLKNSNNFKFLLKRK